MSHNPDNKDCPLSICELNDWKPQIRDVCICPPPAVDRVEEIRARHQDASEELPSPNYNTFTKQLWEMQHDRAALLSALDKANAEMDRLRRIGHRKCTPENCDFDGNNCDQYRVALQGTCE